MARPILNEDVVTAKIEPLPAPNFHARLATKLKEAIDEAREIPAGDSIADALLKLLAYTKRRELEARIDELPDITNEVEAA